MRFFFLLSSIDPNKKDFFFDNFLKNDFLKTKKKEDYKFFKKYEKDIKNYFANQKKKQLDLEELVQYFKDDFYEKEKAVFAVSNRSRYFPKFDVWDFLNEEEELLWQRMNNLWTAVVNYFTDEKFDYLFNKVDKSTKDEDEMLLYSAEELDIYLTFHEEEEEDLFTGLYINDDDPDIVEIYDDDMYMVSFVWTFFIFCFLLCFDFSGFFFFPFFPVIMYHYFMYEPDAYDEDEHDPEQIILDNMYRNDSEFVDYQYEFFFKNSLSLKNLDFLYFANLSFPNKKDKLAKYKKSI